MDLWRPIVAGSTDQSVLIRIIDDTDGTPETGVLFDTSGIDLEYRRDGAAAVEITEATLAGADAAHSDGGFIHVGHGWYRVDLPDAAVASGVAGVAVIGTVPDMIVLGCYVPLWAVNPYDAVRAGMTALPNAAADAAGGLPISDAGGLDLDALVSEGYLDTAQGDIEAAIGTSEAVVTSAIGALEAHGDDNWSAGDIPNGTAQAGGASTITLAAGDGAATGSYAGWEVWIDGGTGAGQTRVVDSDGKSGASVLTVTEAWDTNPDNTSTYRLLPTRALSAPQITTLVDAAIVAAALASAADLASLQSDVDGLPAAIGAREPAAITGVGDLSTLSYDVILSLLGLFMTGEIRNTGTHNELVVSNTPILQWPVGDSAGTFTRDPVEAAS